MTIHGTVCSIRMMMISFIAIKDIQAGDELLLKHYDIVYFIQFSLVSFFAIHYLPLWLATLAMPRPNVRICILVLPPLANLVIGLPGCIFFSCLCTAPAIIFLSCFKSALSMFKPLSSLYRYCTNISN